MKKLQAAHYLGTLFVILGLINRRFIIIRPNRIENGTEINLVVAIKGNFPLMATLFIILLIIVIGLFIQLKQPFDSKKVDVNDSFKKYSYIKMLILHLSSFGLFLYITGQIASLQLITLSTSARASLGIGFWFILIGIILFIWQIVKTNEQMKPWIMLACLLILGVLYSGEILKDISVVREFTDKSDRIQVEVIRHMQLTFAACMTGLFLSFVLSYISYKHKKLERIVSGIANFAQVVPTLSLLGLLMIPLAFLATTYPLLKSMGISGIGFFPAYIVLTLYTLLPMISNILAGFKSIPVSIIEAAQAMGMNKKQLLLQVELPMVFPSIFAGFRIALVQTVGNCILAGLVGGGGIGAILFLGLAQSAPDLVLVASLIVVMIAVVFEVILSTVEKSFIQKVRGELVHD